MKIFNSILTLSFILIFGISTSAQISIGVRAGVNIANQTIEQSGLSVEPDALLGLHLGALVNIGITDDFSVQPELTFIQKGNKFDFDLGTLGGGVVETKTTYNYLEIPILAKYGFGGEKIGGFILAGPSIAFGLSGSSSTDGDSIDLDWEEDGVTRSDFGIQFGAGINFSQLFVDVRYGLGLTDLNDTDDDTFSVKNNGLNIGIGYLF